MREALACGSGHPQTPEKNNPQTTKTAATTTTTKNTKIRPEVRSLRSQRKAECDLLTVLLLACLLREEAYQRVPARKRARLCTVCSVFL